MTRNLVDTIFQVRVMTWEIRGLKRKLLYTRLSLLVTWGGVLWWWMGGV